jgi:hypothetical protein
LRAMVAAAMGRGKPLSCPGRRRAAHFSMMRFALFALGPGSHFARNCALRSPGTR